MTGMEKIGWSARFLPTPSHGGRHAGHARHGPPADISTHALTWRATEFGHCLIGLILHFYPRPHMEGDRMAEPATGSGHDFYPRPHMEGDPFPPPGPESVFISTHALTWRATAGFPGSRL